MSIDKDLEQQFERRKEVSIEIGTPVLMQISGVAGRLPTLFVGMDRQRSYMIFKVPRAEVNLAVRLIRGATVVIRYRHQGRIYGFEAAVLGTVHDPYPLLFVAIPSIIEEHRLRKTQRIDCYRPCMLATSDGEEAGVVINLSHNGIRCLFSGITSAKRTPDQLKEREVAVTFALQDGEEPLSVVARIISAQPLHGAFNCGLRFENLPEAASWKLLAYISEHGTE